VEAREDGLTSVVIDVKDQVSPRAETERMDDAIEEIGRAVDAACSAAGIERSRVGVVTIGFPGSVDPTSDTVRFADDYSGWPASDSIRRLRERLGCLVVLDNDVKLAAVAERSDGAGAGTSDFALLWIGNGLGLAVDIAGSVIRGASGAAGEIGYVPIPAALVDSGVAGGALQDVIGAPAITSLAGIGSVQRPADGDSISELFRHPDLVDTVAVRIAYSVVSALAVVDPSLLVLGGPIGVAGGDDLAAATARQIAELTRWDPRVLPSRISEYQVLRGAEVVLVAQLRDMLLERVGAIS
jgi:predicted NBD/HSP70 family sugar kinase